EGVDGARGVSEGARGEPRGRGDRAGEREGARGVRVDGDAGGGVMTLALIALLLAAPSPCEEKCAGVVKPCVQACDKNMPAAQIAECRKACSNAVAPCKEHCKSKEGGEAK